MICFARILIFLWLVSSHSRSSFAGEPDDFMARADLKAPIANEFINANLNVQFQTVLTQYRDSVSQEKSTKPRATCSRTKILALMVDVFDRNFPDVYGPFGSKTGIDITAGPKTHAESPMMHSIPYSQKLWIPSYRVKTSSGVHSMGIDKIDHFFAHGYLGWMAQENAKKGSKISGHLAALNFNMEQERGPWGLKSSGVKSYADLAANDLGHQFWANLVDGKDPIFQCVNGAYIMKKPFDFFKYLDASVDESINCSTFSKIAIRDAVVMHSTTLGVRCPASIETCRKLVSERSKAVTELTIHPLCREEPSSQIEEPSAKTIKDILDMGSALTSVGNLTKFWLDRSRNSAKILRKKPNSTADTPVQVWTDTIENAVNIESKENSEPLEPFGDTVIRK